jgi:glycerol-3-phosphate dehydrogenase
MVSIGGGKLTTHRLEAMEALRRLPLAVRPHRRAPSSAAVVGIPRLTPQPDVAPETLDHLAATYGDRVGDVLRYGTSDRLAFQRIHPEGPDVWAQVHYAIANELAMTVDDLIGRRTSLRWRGLDDEATREKIARALMPRLVPT